MREDFIRELYDRQTDIAIANLKRIYEVVGGRLNVVFICGTISALRTLPSVP
jgi:predicted GH43/DUF377 family glycosyl hydrolase